MASAEGIRAGKAYVELSVNNSQFVRGLNAAASRLKSWGAAISAVGTKVMGLGTAIVAPMVGAAKIWGSTGAEMLNMSKRTGISVERLSELKFAANQCNVEIETFETGIRKMQQTLVDAASGSDSAQTALNALGLTAKDLAGLPADEQFKRIADGLSQIKDPTLRAAVALDIFGRSGTALLPLVEDGAKGIEQLQDRARKLGLTMSTENAEAAAEFDAALQALWSVLREITTAIGSATAAVIRQFTQACMQVAPTVLAWVKRNQDLLATIFKVAAGVLAAGAAIFLLGKIIAGVGMAIRVVSTAFTTLTTVLGPVVSILTAILSPVGLVIAAVVGLGGYILYATELGGQALSWLGQRFADLARFAGQAWQGISDALATGDIGLAANILWLSLKLAWVKGVNWLQGIWLDFKYWLLSKAQDAWHGLQATAQMLWHGLQIAWIDGVAALKSVWASLVSWHRRASEEMANGMVKSWIWAREKTGAISKEQADFERRYVQGQHEDAVNQINRERDAARTAAEGERQAARQAEDERYNAEMSRIADDARKASDTLKAEQNAQVKAAEADLAAARREFDAARDKARQGRETGKAAGPPAMKKPAVLGDVDAMWDALQKKTVGVIGTFNVSAAWGLASGGVADRLAKSSEATANNTRRLLDEVRARGGAAFE